MFSTSKADRCGGSGRLLGEVFQAWPNGSRLRRDYICQLAWESLTAPQNEVAKERDVWTCVFLDCCPCDVDPDKQETMDDGWIKDMYIITAFSSITKIQYNLTISLPLSQNL